MVDARCDDEKCENNKDGWCKAKRLILRPYQIDRVTKLKGVLDCISWKEKS